MVEADYIPVVVDSDAARRCAEIDLSDAIKGGEHLLAGDRVTGALRERINCNT